MTAFWAGVAGLTLFLAGLAVGFKWGKEALGREIYWAINKELAKKESPGHRLAVLQSIMWFCERYL